MLALLALLPALALAAPAAINKRYSGVLIQSYRDGQCISVQGGPSATVGNGVPVVSVPCSQASLWDINPGSGSVLVHGNNGYALDAGSNPGNNGALKIWTSYPGLYQQTWYLTGDNRIAITGGNQCLDEGTNGIQTYQCTTGNTNQIFNAQTPGVTAPSSSTSVVVPSSTSSTSASASATPSGTSPNIPPGVTYPDPAGQGSRIHPNGRSDLCATVTNGYAGIGSAVQITYCFSNNDPNAALQLWNIPAAGATGPIVLKQSGLCLDAGSNPANGSGLKVYTCYAGLLQQTWTRSGGTGTLALSNSQCLDVVAGSGPIQQKPYGSEESLQTWQCSNNGDPQQVFFTL